jgi:alpha-beta hydrolase superfamily lysophospholipase
MIEKVITAQDNHQIQVYIWPNKQAKAWVHINHGMAEHAKRYDLFAQQLVLAGYAVVAHNHRGHGESETTQLGSYAKDLGWDKVLEDLEVVRDDICDQALPYYLFGHSMGSFIVQSYLTRCTRKIDGLVLSGSNLQPVLLSKAGKFVAKIERKRLGQNNSSRLLQFLSFGTFNQAFKPNRTEYDWLSRDAQQVDQYVSDPLCGFACSTGLWHDFLAALAELYSKGSLNKIQKNLPIFIIGGSQDPVGMMGKGLPKLAQAYKKIGQQQVSLKLYEQGRHEMLNESNQPEVIQDIITWFTKQEPQMNL